MTDAQTFRDYDALKRGLWYAQKNGYRVPPLELAMFTSAGAEKLEGSLRTWAIGVILSHDFARAVFGSDELYNSAGTQFNAIHLWIKQVAFEVFGKLHKIDRNRQQYQYVFLKEPEIDYKKLSESAPTEIVEAEQVIMKIEDMAASIPFRTHELAEVEVIGAIPGWQHHLREMVIADNPFEYLKKYVDEKQYGKL